MSSMQGEQSGGCLCGSFRYTFNVTAEPDFSFSCHCRDCQQATGSVCATAFAVPKDGFQMSGEYKFYTKYGDNGGEINRGFCPSCGSRAVSTLGALPDLYLVYASSLDDPSWFKPAMNIYTASALPWDCMDPNVPNFAQSPPAG
ncbi:MAG: GFA family protein [Pseudomonadales bacterium]|jgi:hypothetical protein